MEKSKGGKVKRSKRGKEERSKGQKMNIEHPTFKIVSEWTF